MPRGFSDLERERIRNMLLQEGRGRLDTTGVSKTTIEDLATAAHISKGAFYKFFPSKEALFFCIFEELEQELKHKFAGMLSGLDRKDVCGSLKKMIVQILYSQEMQAIFKHSEDYDYVIRTVNPTTLETHLSHDLIFIEEVYIALQKMGIDVTSDPEEAVAYLHGIFYLFFGSKSISKKYFRNVVESSVETLVEVALGIRR